MSAEVTRRRMLQAGALVGGALALGSLASRRAPRRRPGDPSVGDPPGPVTGAWVDPDAPRRIRLLAKPIEDLVGWPGLGDYLSAVAYTESRGNPNATGPGPSANAARGWFQIRPASARVEELGLSPSVLYDEGYAVALAAWYAHRLRNYRFPGQVMDWFAVRRGWAKPSLVSDVDLDMQRSREVLERFEIGVARVGLPDSFIYRVAFPPGYQWPGVAAVIGAVKGTS